jgi:hypothetical protein
LIVWFVVDMSNDTRRTGSAEKLINPPSSSSPSPSQSILFVATRKVAMRKLDLIVTDSKKALSCQRL